ncbi:MAG: membrane protein insertase YidC [Rhodothermia bacterium]
MDRNAVLAVILISLIMTVWLVWFSPEPPAPAPVTTTDQTSRPPEVDTTISEGGLVTSNATTIETTADSSFAQALEGEARYLSVETENYTAVLSSKGATLVSFELKKYRQFDQETPVQMIEPGQGGAIGLEFTSPSSHLVSSRDLFFDVDVDQESVNIGDVERVITFASSLAEGQLIVRYTFKPDSYEIGMEIEKRNASEFMTRAGYDLVWNGGIPFAEGVGGQEAQVSAAIARSGGELEQINLRSEQAERTNLNGNIEWIAVRNGFFAAVMIPDGETRGAELEGVRLDDAAGTVLGNHYNARLMVPEVGSEVDAYRFYIGPIDFYEIRDYGLDLYDIVDYGFGQTITRPIAKWVIIPVFNILSKFVSNYGLIILLFSVFIKLILFPLTKSSFKSMAMMKQLQPQMAEIKEKHADNPQKQQQAMMKLYKDSGVNPIGGCLPQLLQMPILYALFRFFPSAIEMRQQGFLWSNDLSAPDVLFELPFTLPIYGAHVSGFPLLMSAAMIVQMRLQGTHQQQAGQMKVMMMIMPVFILVIFNNFAAGLSLYYLAYNVLSAVQQKFINKSLEEEGIHSKSEPQMKAGKGGKGGKSSKGGKGSKPPRPKASKNGRDKSSRKKKSGSRA